MIYLKWRWTVNHLWDAENPYRSNLRRARKHIPTNSLGFKHHHLLLEGAVPTKIIYSIKSKSFFRAIFFGGSNIANVLEFWTLLKKFPLRLWMELQATFFSQERNCHEPPPLTVAWGYVLPRSTKVGPCKRYKWSYGAWHQMALQNG